MNFLLKFMAVIIYPIYKERGLERFALWPPGPFRDNSKTLLMPHFSVSLNLHCHGILSPAGLTQGGIVILHADGIFFFSLLSKNLFI